MSATLLAEASTFFAGLQKNALVNCYWDGTATTEGGVIVPRGPAVSKCTNIPNDIPAQATIGWPPPVPGDAYPFIGVDNAKGTARFIALTECSGFVSWLLTRLRIYGTYIHWITEQRRSGTPAANALNTIDRRHIGAPWPSAADYAYAGVFGNPPAPYSVVGNNDTLADALRNDRVTGGQILAYALEESNDTGHVMVIDSVGAGADADTWDVVVYDASSVPHQNDQRPGGTGVGHGTVSLQYAGDGRWQFKFLEAFDPVGPVVVLGTD